MPEPRFLSVAAAAKALGVSTVTVYRWTEAGRLPSVKFGARRLVPVEAIDRIVAQAFEPAEAD